MFPETAGLGLEEIDFLFAKGANNTGAVSNTHDAINVAEILGSINAQESVSVNKKPNEDQEQEKGRDGCETKVQHVEDSQ